MDQQVVIHKFLFRKEWPVLKDILQGQEADDFVNASELVTCLSDERPNLIFVSLTDKNDLTQISSLAKMLKPLPKNISVKVVAVNFSRQPQFEAFIQKFGIQEIVEPHIAAKAFKFKYDIWLKGLLSKNKKGSEPQTVLEQKKSTEKETKKENGIVWKEAVSTENDMWLLKNEATDCKRILGRWMIKLKGPGPYAGQWESIQGQKNVWEFVLKPEYQEVFLGVEGSWFFSGEQKPDFIWKENLWLITGAQFRLFHKDSSKEEVRVEFKGKDLNISANSLTAKNKEMFIDESFDTEVKIKNEKISNENDSVEQENHISTRLEGEGATDHLENNDLSGKIKKSENGLDPLSGDVEGTDNLGKNTYEGELSPEGRAAKEREQKNLKTSEHEEKDNPFEGQIDQLKGHYKSRQEVDGPHEDAEGPESNHKKTEKSKNKKGKKEDYIDDMSAFDDLEGESQTEKLDKYYGTRKKESEDADDEEEGDESSPYSKKKNKTKKDKKTHEGSDELAGFDELDGEGETDHLSSYYGTKKSHGENNNSPDEDSAEQGKDQETKNKKKKNSAEYLDDSSAMDELSGVSSTDEIDQHYSSPNLKKKNQKEKEQEEDASSDLKKDGKKKARKQDLISDLLSDESLLEEELFSEENSHAKDKKNPELKTSTERLDGYYRKAPIKNEEGQNKQEEDEQAEDTKLRLEEELNLEDLMGPSSGRSKSRDRKNNENAKQQDQLGNESEEDAFLEDLPDPTNKSEEELGLQDEFETQSESEDFNQNGLNTSVSSSARKQKNKKDSQAQEEEFNEEEMMLLDQESMEHMKAPEDPTLKRACEDAWIKTYVICEDRTYECKLEDIFEQEMTLMTKESFNEVVSVVKIKVVFNYLKRESTFHFSGEVASLDESYLNVLIAPDYQLEIEKLMKLFFVRQEHIKVFMRYATGS